MLRSLKQRSFAALILRIDSTTDVYLIKRIVVISKNEPIQLQLLLARCFDLTIILNVRE